jgi:flagellar hook-length control protein FliK
VKSSPAGLADLAGVKPAPRGRVDGRRNDDNERDSFADHLDVARDRSDRIGAQQRDRAREAMEQARDRALVTERRPASPSDRAQRSVRSEQPDSLRRNHDLRQSSDRCDLPREQAADVGTGELQRVNDERANDGRADSESTTELTLEATTSAAVSTLPVAPTAVPQADCQIAPPTGGQEVSALPVAPPLSSTTSIDAASSTAAETKPVLAEQPAAMVAVADGATTVMAAGSLDAGDVQQGAPPAPVASIATSVPDASAPLAAITGELSAVSAQGAGSNTGTGSSDTGSSGSGSSDTGSSGSGSSDTGDGVPSPTNGATLGADTVAPAIAKAVVTASMEPSANVTAGAGDVAVGKNATNVAAVPSPLAVSAPDAAPVAPPASPPPPLQQSPAQQLLSVLRPLRKFADGSHRLSVRLSPDELGSVTVELSLRSGTLSMHMVAERSATGDLLHNQLHELRRELEQGGVRTGSFEVGQQAADGRRNPTASAVAKTASSIGIDEPLIDVASISPGSPTRSADSRLDVRI